MHDTTRSTASARQSELSTANKSQRTLAALQVFAGGACYGAMATTYKLAYAAGFTSNQVVASQAWFGCLFFVLAVLIGRARGKRLSALPVRTVLKLMGLGALTCLTSILYCYAMSVLPAPVALTLLFQFTWMGLVWQTIMTRRAPRPIEIASAAVIVAGTVFASGVYQTGIRRLRPRRPAVRARRRRLMLPLCHALRQGQSTVRQRAARGDRLRRFGNHVAHRMPDYLVSGVLTQGILPFAAIAGFFGLMCPVLLFGLGSPHLPAGLPPSWPPLSSPPASLSP